LVIESKVCPCSHAFVGGMDDFASAARLIFARSGIGRAADDTPLHGV
jgi:hypothetical protein